MLFTLKPLKNCYFTFEVVTLSKESFRHWVDDTVNGLLSYWGNVKCYVCNCGLSVSGLQHIGRLRGEVILTNTVKEELQRRGHEAKHFLVLYTQDQWKGKESQIEVFSDREFAKSLVGRRLVDVPDPQDCHGSWVEHFWEPFGKYLDEFAVDVNVISTTELYKRDEVKSLVKEVFLRPDEIRGLINKYRGRKPYPDGWIPFEPLCNNCKVIGGHRILRFDLSSYTVEYECGNCGERGWSNIEDGKLNWRVEWAALWVALGVNFEPYGKDHATPGGSRDSCVEIVQKFFGKRPPYGMPYEWVALAYGGKEIGDMGSSDFMGITPEDWLLVAEPEVLRYLCLKNKPMRRMVIDPTKVPDYSDIYDHAERVFYGFEEVEQEKERFEIIRSYELSQLKPPPEEMPVQLKYGHAVTLVQVLPKDTPLQSAIKRLKSTGLVRKDQLSSLDIKRIENRLKKAKNWVIKYAPENLRIQILDHVPPEIKKSLSDEQKTALKAISRLLLSKKFTEEELEQELYRIAKEESGLGSRAFFKTIYLVLLGKEQGPRLAPFLLLLEREWLISRLEEVAE